MVMIYNDIQFQYIIYKIFKCIFTISKVIGVKTCEENEIFSRISKLVLISGDQTHTRRAPD